MGSCPVKGEKPMVFSLEKNEDSNFFCEQAKKSMSSKEIIKQSDIMIEKKLDDMKFKKPILKRSFKRPVKNPKYNVIKKPFEYEYEFPDN